jgi:hypothetical protein
MEKSLVLVDIARFLECRCSILIVGLAQVRRLHIEIDIGLRALALIVVQQLSRGV